MRCYHCGRDNLPNYLVCSGCRKPRVIDPTQATGAVSLAPRHTGATGAATATVVPPTTGAAVTFTRPTTPPQTGAGRFARDSTRYLCAAAHTNAAFNERMLQGIMDERYRAVASSPGVDLVTVLRHGLAARRRLLVRDLALTMLLVISYLAFVRAQLTLVLTCLLVAWAVVFGNEIVTWHGVLARRLRRGVFDPSREPSTLSSQARQRLAEIARQDRGNVTVFPEYSPFIGHGKIYKTWSFVINVAKPALGETVTPFTVHDLYHHIAQQVSALGLPGVAVEDRIFISGLDLLDESEPSVQKGVLPDPLRSPLASVDGAMFRRVRDDPKSRARYYLGIRVNGWSGELVLTVFLRCALLPQRDLLFVEASYSLLTPVLPRYREVDRVRTVPTVLQALRTALVTALKTPVRLVMAPVTVARTVSGPLTGWLKEIRDVREIRSEKSFNYGAVLSPRELASDQRYDRYFQQLDTDMYAKMVERRILDALAGFMKQHGVDVEEFSERQATIVNHGMFLTGQATLKANSIAVGLKAIANAFTGSGPDRGTDRQAAPGLRVAR